ncbi:MAG TPA: IclR family transcriptional regulator [Plasticicumulans sp.]|nr:IclR family transcriptional regulator [Plasticicumulans sp.]HNB91112.1 IclR family transcriptional regulator [Plasticicumulans sp.]HNF67522.1 IclR family transcriptional regulator [Plasticicumulans sp.]HNI24097.1 IclR family transcriptional regulator [Plasticicumulans sp.]HNJ09382.1 IclR family transcriptional regulator [Plasticicumulans sp.]
MQTTSSIQVIDRLARLLDAIAANNNPVSLKVLSAETGLHPSTAFRILASLAEHGFVERSSSGHYRLGVKLLQLGSRVQGRLDIRREARPIMEWLRNETGETVNLIVREGDEVVYVERVVPNRMMRVEQMIGGRAPLHVTAVGKLFLAEGGAEACLEYAARTGLPSCTPHSITDPTALWRSVKNALQQGYALDDQEAELGVGCIGVPIRDSTNHIVAGISVSAPIERRREVWVTLIRQAGEKLSTRLGFHPENRPVGA